MQQQSKQMSSDASQTHVEASALQDAQQLSARHVDSLRHEIFHQTKAHVKGLSQGECTRLPSFSLLLVHTDRTKTLLVCVGPVKAKWIKDRVCCGATSQNQRTHVFTLVKGCYTLYNKCVVHNCLILFYNHFIIVMVGLSNPNDIEFLQIAVKVKARLRE